MKGADMAEDAVDAVRSRPYAAGGVVAAIAMFLARDPIRDLAGKLVDGVSKKRTTKGTPQAAPSKAQGASEKRKETETAE